MIRAVIFDMDGTITKPWLDFKRIRTELAMEEPLLEKLLELPEGSERARKFQILHRFEQEAVEASELNEGAAEILNFLRERDLRTGLLTRNSRTSASTTLARHQITFEVIVTREDAPIKPSPAPVQLICSRLEIRPEQVLVVGDYKYDIMAGQRAGTKTCLLTNGNTPGFTMKSDYVIAKLAQLTGILS